MKITKEQLYKALEYGKYGVDLVDTDFQFSNGEYEKINNINLSDLFSLLIREAGRLCDNYASDMFYDMKALFDDLHGETSKLFEDENYLNVVGIRDSGVDHESFILSRSGSDSFTYLYRELLLIKVTPLEGYKGLKKLSCFKVSPSSVDHYIKRNYEV